MYQQPQDQQFYSDQYPQQEHPVQRRMNKAKNYIIFAILCFLAGVLLHVAIGLFSVFGIIFACIPFIFDVTGFVLLALAIGEL